ncbi:twin-arginine translocase TatA/TatE family subunit [Rhodomicrobium sp.]|jgi:sec-independent protein translocase protein TatA|uniref:twin-arginine translocase TatA/TatE family subunit n=1 Tax=Rhodomicrobium sp. TaxID=2720632 RepID=UPI0039E53564
MHQDLMFGATWSLPQLLIVLLLVVLLFGRGKISELMGDVAKGIKSFKKGMSEEEAATPPAAAQSTAAPTAPAAPKPIEHEAPRAEVKAPLGSETKA